MTPGQTNRLLGYPPDARLLIVNADDFGMCAPINQAIMAALAHGIVGSTTVMPPCPGAAEALQFLAAHPTVAFGIHLTVIRDTTRDRYGPLNPPERVPSLVGADGRFLRFDEMAALLARARLEELEIEFRAQIAAVLGAGLSPTHLDWHSLRISGHPAVFDLMARLAKEYGLALRVFGQANIARVQGQGMPTNDHDFLDSSQIDTADKLAHLARLLRTLPAGLSEWAVHPGLDTAEMRAIQPETAHIRQTDYEAVTSPALAEIIREEGIILLNYRPLQAVWRGA